MAEYVLITGATGGLGKAFAAECAARGWDLFLTDISDPALDRLVAGLKRMYDVQIESYACDLTSAASRQDLWQHIEGQDLRFHTLINVAGLDYEGPFDERQVAELHTVIRLNIEATLEMTHAIMAYRDPTRPFRIINVASLAAYYPMPVKATYAASKRFLMDFSFALRSELREMGATVTVLCPAGMPTTRDCVRAIDAQGILGQLTTQNTGTVANQTLNAALKGEAVCIPGSLNRLIQFAGSLIPTAWVVSLIGSRWKTARQKQIAQAEDGCCAVEIAKRFPQHNKTSKKVV